MALVFRMRGSDLLQRACCQAIVVFAALFVPTTSRAATLNADALLCEQESDLQFIDRHAHLNGLGGAALMKQAEMHIKLIDLKRRAALQGMVINDSRARVDDLATWQRVLLSCASTAEPSSVEVVERRPISGLVQVRLTYNNRRATLWTKSERLSD